MHAELTSVYPGNLCVTRVEHSTAELDAVVERLAVAGDSWVLDAHSLQQSISNRVLLELPVLDPRRRHRHRC